MKHKHNKMKNIAILYECATREIAVLLQKEEKETAKQIAKVLTSSLRKTELGEELRLYKDLTETTDLDKDTAKTLLNESIVHFGELNEEKKEKQRVSMVSALSKINKKMFGNFVPNYRQLATIYQLFNKTATPKNKMLLENEMVESLSSTTEQLNEQQLQPIDALVYKNFVKRFNEKYNNKLNENQAKLIQLFTFSVKDKEIPLKNFINEELPRLKESVENFSKTSANDKIKENAKNILSVIEGYKNKQTLKEKDILKVLQLQELEKEINDNVSNHQS